MTADKKNVPVATHFGKIVIGDKSLSCAVLQDGSRVLTKTAIFQAFERQRKGTRGADQNELNLPDFVCQNNLKPLVYKALGGRTNLEIKYIGKNKKEMVGYDAEILPLICEMYLQARDLGVLTDSQKPLAIISDILIRSFAKVGIVALIDEATGYQKERELNELQKLLELYISKDLLPWTKTFPDEFYMQMFRLRGWDYKGKPKNAYVGKLTNYLVYDRLPSEVIDELKRQHNMIEDTHKGAKLHQMLTKNWGYVELQKFIHTATIMMGGFDSWNDFNSAFKKSFGIQEELKDDGGEAK